MKQRRNHRSQLLVMSMPFLLATGILIFAPVIVTSILAFTRYDGLTSPRFTGLANLRAMFADPIFRTSLWNSITYVSIATPLRVMGMFLLAVLLARRRRGVGVYRATTYLPSVIPDVAYALMWLWLLNPLYGPVSFVLRGLGTDGGILLTPWGARLSIVGMTLFQIGEGFLVMLVARGSLPEYLFEAGRLEGASPTYLFTRITLPMLAPAVVLLGARDIALSFQTNFVPALTVTEGGPIYATTYLPLHIYRNAFEFFRFGYASAMTLTMYVFTAAIIGIQLLALRRFRLN